MGCSDSKACGRGKTYFGHLRDGQTFRHEDKDYIKRNNATAYRPDSTGIMVFHPEAVVSPVNHDADGFKPAVVTTPADVLATLVEPPKAPESPTAPACKAFVDYLSAEADHKKSGHRLELAIATLRASLVKAGMLDRVKDALS